MRIPHPSKKREEDFSIESENFLVVADGVGGWAEVGVDSGEYSRELCRNISSIFASDKLHFSLNPKQLLV